MDLVRRANSYAEITPSGTGIRIFGRGIVPPALAERASVKIWDKGSHPSWPGLEVPLFLQSSYITLSGDKIEGAPIAVTENQEFLDYLLRQNPAKLKTYFPAEAAARAGAASRRLTAFPANEIKTALPSGMT
jgi:hypothetical protein